jgi:protein SCO1/2
MSRAILATLLIVLASGVTRAGPEELPELRKKLFTPRLGDQVPADIWFRDSTGKVVRMGDFGKDKPYILVLAYYKCPMLCTLVLNDLVKGLRGVPFSAGEEFEVVVVSFDPREKPDLAAAKKAAYVEDYGRPGAERGWHFMTGEQAQIDRLMEAVGFRAVWDEKDQQYIHARGVLIMTAGGMVARYFLGGWYPPRDLRMALVEASEGQIAAPMDRILLMCFSYNPSSGKYSAAVLRLVQAGGVATMAAVGLFWLASWRRGRRAGRETKNEERETKSG